jgi:hypothetical protein
MKFLHLVCLFGLVFTTLHGEPAVKADGLAGIPIGADADQVKKAMDARGAVFVATKSTSGHLEFEGGTFNGEPVGSWHFYFFTGKLYKASVRIGALGIGNLQAYERFKKTISERYGVPFQATKTELEPEQMNDLLRRGKLELESNWRVEGTRNSVAARFFRTPTGVMALRIIYQDDAVEAQVLSQQKDDI